MAEPSPERGGMAELSRYLRALGEPNRLEMLRLLQVPLQLHEIEVRPARKRAGLRPSRALSRQAVQEHLARLRDLGLVQRRAARRGGRQATEYVVNHARLFIVVEEMRRLNQLRAAEAAAEGTVAGAGGGREALPMPAGPALVLVGGPLDGAVFRLRGGGPWVVGRDEGLAATLDYDPYVSKRNTELALDGPALVARDLPGSRNGTRVNWRPLGPGEAAPLAPGDVLGVGRSALVVRGALPPGAVP